MQTVHSLSRHGLLLRNGYNARVTNLYGYLQWQVRSTQWRSQPDNLVPLCKFQSIIIIHFFRN